MFTKNIHKYVIVCTAGRVGLYLILNTVILINTKIIYQVCRYIGRNSFENHLVSKNNIIVRVGATSNQKISKIHEQFGPKLRKKLPPWWHFKIKRILCFHGYDLFNTIIFSITFIAICDRIIAISLICTEYF